MYKGMTVIWGSTPRINNHGTLANRGLACQYCWRVIEGYYLPRGVKGMVLKVQIGRDKETNKEFMALRKFAVVTMLEAGTMKGLRFDWSVAQSAVKTQRTVEVELVELPDRLILLSDYMKEFGTTPSDNGHMTENIFGEAWVAIPAKREMLRTRKRSTVTVEETTHMVCIYQIPRIKLKRNEFDSTNHSL